MRDLHREANEIFRHTESSTSSPLQFNALSSKSDNHQYHEMIIKIIISMIIKIIISIFNDLHLRASAISNPSNIKFNTIKVIKNYWLYDIVVMIFRQMELDCLHIRTRDWFRSNINIYNIGVRTTDWFRSWQYIHPFFIFLNDVVLSSKLSSWKYCWQKMIKTEQYQERPVRELYNVCLNHNLQWPRWQ